MELSDKQYETVVMVVGLASKVQAARLNPDGGPNLRWRIEVAAAFLAAVLDHAVSAGEANDASCEYMTDLAIELTVRRAQEIFGQITITLDASAAGPAFLNPQRRLSLCEEQDAAVHNTKAAILIAGRLGFDERPIGVRPRCRAL